MGLFNTMSISGSGLTAERLRMDLISENLANINTTRTDEGGPYKRKVAVFGEKLQEALNNNGQKVAQPAGVEVMQIANDPAPSKKVYDPSHPDADAQGYVSYPNVNVVKEMVDMITASRAYEANVTALNAAKSMALKALEIGRG